ncbi:MAG TPA: sensor histidine kinase [Savagea sp.]
MKAIRLFVKEHVALFLFQLFLIAFILLLYWLDGFRNYGTAIYALILGIVFTCLYLIGKFILRRTYYTKIVKEPVVMEDLLIRHSTTPEHIRSTRYMREAYRLYQSEVQQLYAAQHRQLHFINQWVHQMKTPLSVMSLLLQEEGAVDRTSVQEELDKMQRGLEAVLVNARLETFEEDMRIERLHLKTFVQSIVTEHKRLFITNRVFPTIDIADDLYVSTDRKWMKIVIAQFITNAVKYTFEEGKKVHFIAEPLDKSVQLRIVDEGVGIPASDLERVTKPFFTGENGRLTGESTGMGLYIASEVCERLGHTLLLSSEVGKGTTITVTFQDEKGGDSYERSTDYRIDEHHENL